MNLTADQQRAIQNGEAVPITFDQTECVLLRRDVFERIRRVVEYDDSSWTDEEKTALLRSFGEKAGWDDPELDVYEQYRKHAAGQLTDQVAVSVRGAERSRSAVHGLRETA